MLLNILKNDNKLFFLNHISSLKYKYTKNKVLNILKNVNKLLLCYE